MQFAGKRAIVTGGAGAIGGAIAVGLAAAGCEIAVIDRVTTEGIVAEIASQGQRAFTVSADLASPDQTRAAIRQAMAELDGLDILVNAAGIVSYGAAATLAEPEWDRVMNINLKSVFIACQTAMEAMRRPGGRIINIGSVLGKNGGNARPWLDPSEQKSSANIAYGISKAGVHALTIYLARELASAGITVNAVAPGPIQTAMTSAFPRTLRDLIPVGRLGLPREVADAVAFLAAEGSAYITGEVLDINGGIWSD
jgi:NAD(P)-dependent dehydrogenase (short-subunit alcohol dehydrogenase family)